jgi:hypothetical protein
LADRGTHPKPVLRVDRRPVQRRPQGTLAGQDADQVAPRVDHRGQPVVAGDQPVERLLRVHLGGQGQQVTGHDGAELGEPVDVGAVHLGDHADGSAVLYHHHRAVRPLGQQYQRVGDRVGRGERDRRVVYQVPPLDPGHHLGDDVDRDVLRDDRETAATRHRLGHPAAGDRGHVRHEDRDRRARRVERGEVDVHPRLHRGAARHHEYVVVRQVVRRRLGDEAHMAQYRG